MKNSTLKAPAHLRPDTRAWWLYVHTNWRLEAHHSRLLEMACDAWDRYHEVRDILARDGIVVGGRQAAARPHPCIAIERDNRIVFARFQRTASPLGREKNAFATKTAPPSALGSKRLCLI